MEAAILEAELAVVRLQEVSEDPVIINDHVKAAKTFEELSKAQDLVAERYARWAELEA
jgi:hypothetical protein